MFSPEKSAYILQQTPTTWHRSKMFTLKGFVVEINLELDFTKMKVMVITFRNKEEVREIFELYFMGTAREFIDRHANEGDLIDAAGDMIVSKCSTPEQQIIKLNVKDSWLWRKYGNAYKQISEIIKAEETDNEDLAF